MLTITLKEATGFLESFAAAIGSKVNKGRVKVPTGKGKGYIQGFLFDGPLNMMIRNYELNEDLLSQRLANPDTNQRIILSFDNVFRSDKNNSDPITGFSIVSDLASARISKGNIDVALIYPGKTKFRSIMIAVDTAYLKMLLGPEGQHTLLDKILISHQPLLFEQLLSPGILDVASEIMEAALPETLRYFFYRIKTEELICLLFAELLQREDAPVHALHENDVQKIYQVRDTLLSRLDRPPVIEDLAKSAGMSTSKLKRLFRQIFGNSIFNYYQGFRMQEAARLLREYKLTVSETGYRLGFSNLSHFGRLFEQHFGMKPKKYSQEFQQGPSSRSQKMTDKNLRLPEPPF